MNEELITKGKVKAHWNVASTRVLKYSCELIHSGLKEHKLISAPDKGILENKVETQISKWTEKWDKEETKNKNLEFAEEATSIAEEIIKETENILKHALSVDNTVNWSNLVDSKEFNEPYPEKPQKKSHKKIPGAPNPQSEKFVPKYNILEKIFKSLKKKKDNFYTDKFNDEYLRWEKIKNKIEQNNLNIDIAYEKELTIWNDAVKNWEGQKKEFLIKQEAYNREIYALKEKYFDKEKFAILEYCRIVLSNSVYPDFFTKEFVVDYDSNNEILVIEYSLPDIDNFPTLKEVKYFASKNEVKEFHISEIQLSKFYDETMYKVALRSFHELFEADITDSLKAISFNGWVNSVNRATGKYENKCILSVQTQKSEFIEIDLAKVNPKICFKSLKGVASSTLSSLTPIQPILQISRADKRFIESYDVAGGLNEATNIAAMDWEDFEHLIREVFEKEFSSNGGEIKVTQASRDGGVDAVAFDPDPVKGGKIVIQAKRYTNTVGVSAVRDLYGTVLNEGAMKGILVTTASYGPEAYSFAKDKPLTLINGANLLYMLEKHGHHVKIDLKEAKRFLSNNR